MKRAYHIPKERPSSQKEMQKDEKLPSNHRKKSNSRAGGGTWKNEEEEN